MAKKIKKGGSKFQRNLEKIQKLARENEGMSMSNMQSTNPAELIKGILQSSAMGINKTGEPKTMFFDPMDQNVTALGHKGRGSQLTPAILRAMANTPLIYSIISTRVDQVASFAVPQPNKYELGFTVREKNQDKVGGESLLDSSNQETIKEIQEFILKCGKPGHHFHESDFEDYLRQTTFDSLILDSDCTEVVRSRNEHPQAFLPIDGGTIYRAMSEVEANATGQQGMLGEKKRGFFPSHVQVIDNTRIEAEYYPWEIEVSTRNRSTDIRKNGYGMSELEVLIQTVTWMLYGDRYNGNFFTNGSAPKGILKFGDGYNKTQMKAFRQEWTSMMQGAENSWKIPMLNGEVEWVDLQKNNTDMQFGHWQEYLLKISCAVFKISPEEIGFSLSSGSSRPLFEGSAEDRLTHSQNRGLKPLLRRKQAVINKIIQSHPEWKEFEFVFSGLGVESEKEEVELDIKKLQYMQIDEIRIKNGLPALGGVEGAVLSNPNVTQNLQMELQKEQQAAMVGESGGDPESDNFIDGLLGEGGSTTDSNPSSTSANGTANNVQKSLIDYYLIKK